MMYQGMNTNSGRVVEDIDHIRQSISKILLTPIGSRITRRSFGSLMSELIDQPQNDTTRLQLMAATYSAINRWEPRVSLTAVTVTTQVDGQMIVDVSGRRNDTTASINISIPYGSTS
ncbi:TPA: GPW/gp25 family protein [Serratia marcescens]